ncbi:MAG: hypothetical protein MR868_12260 [Lachnospiraceae bacterium]|nr:hypothetical protein [Lachnospiraceae bacterium]
MGKEKAQNQSLPSTEKAPINSEQQKIVEWLKKVRFRKQLFGGVSEADVWKKIDELNKLYDAALTAERIRYETLLAENKTGILSPEERQGDG